MANQLYYGDNLHILRKHIKSDSVDLVYLDPPFNSNATYNVLFRSPTGEHSQAQIEAFDDTWHWKQAEVAFDEVMASNNSDASALLRSMRSFLKENDMMAYLTMMAVRLLELHRVLKPSGSLFLHCDPTASHYLKVLLDAIFGKTTYQNEIVWAYRRWPTKAHRFQRMHDTILFYTKGDEPKTFHTLLQPPTASSMKRWKGKKQSVTFDEDGVRNPTQELDEDSGGVALNDVWNIPVIAPVSHERLGYPTQKPLALLERILSTASNEGDIVLDPFCGCGTTIHAAEKLKRNWLGIDITHLAIALVERRLREAFPVIKFETAGVPKDLAGARDLAVRDKHQFQLWALAQIGAQPFKGGKKGGDSGVDGYLYFKPDGKTTEKAVVSVKGGQNLSPNMIRDLIATVEQDGAKMGFFITLEAPTSGMRKTATAAGLYKTEYGKYVKIQVLTVEDIFAGKKPHMPWVDSSAFRKAATESGEHQPDLLDIVVRPTRAQSQRAQLHSKKRAPKKAKAKSRKGR